jgi:outer membrane protein assembly factor BamD
MNLRMQRTIIFFVLVLTLLLANLQANILDQSFAFFSKSNEQKSDELLASIEASILLEKAKETIQKGKYKKALKIYKKIYKEYPTSKYAPQALYQMGKLQITRNKYKKAFSLLNKIVLEYPNYPPFNQVIAEQYKIAKTMTKEKKSKYFGIGKYRQKNKAISYFESIIKNAPFSKYAPLCLESIATIHLERKHKNQAIQALEKLISKYKNSPLETHAYLLLAQTYASKIKGPEYDQETTLKAINYYKNFIALCKKSDPDLENAKKELAKINNIYAKSKYLMGLYYYKHLKNNKAAENFLHETITLAPNSKSAQQAKQILSDIHK